jgi:hypothetical protein
MESQAFRDAHVHMMARPDYHFAYYWTEYDSINPIHSFIEMPASDDLALFCRQQALDGNVYVDRVENTPGHLAAWARGQYNGVGKDIDIGNWVFTKTLFRQFGDAREQGADQPVFTLQQAADFANIGPGQRYWLSFLTFCIYSRLVQPEPVEMGPDMYTMGTRLPCIPDEERVAARHLMDTWRGLPRPVRRLPPLPRVV